MNWSKITLGQFQDIYRLSKDTEMEEMERITRAISIVYGLSELQIDELSISKFNELGKSCGFLMSEAIPGKQVKSFMVGAKKYAINYKPSTLKHRQYVEILHFADQPIDNMHSIMASLVEPIKWGFRRKNNVDDHSKVSEDMLNAPFVAVYHSCVFFCKLYRDLMERIRPFLIREMMMKGATMRQATKLLTDSINGLDGFIKLNSSRILSE